MDENGCKKRNTRSKELICNSMMELLNEKRFEEISITELCEKSELARKTFYRNFKSKEEVIKVGMDMLFSEFVKSVDINENIDFYELSLAYFEFWYTHKVFLRNIFNNDLFNIVNSQYNLYIRVFRRMMKGEEEMSNDLEYFIMFASGGFWNVLQNWVRKEFSDTPQEMARISSKHMDRIKSDL